MKTVTVALAGLALALTPALAAPSSGTPPQAASGTALSAPAGHPVSVQILSDGKAVATLTLPQGAANVRYDRASGNGKCMTLKGHVSMSVTQGDQTVFQLRADEARVAW